MMETSTKFVCAFCGAENVIEVDVSVGLVQEFIEDCEVCCRPNKLRITFDENTLTPHTEAIFDE